MTIQADAVIVGAGPCGLFQVFELGLLGIRAHIVDALTQPGGQCTELYPDKPIYDIPALPSCGARELIDRLQQQIEPFAPTCHLGQQVQTLQRVDADRFALRTDRGTEFVARSVIIAAGVGAFQPVELKVPGADVVIDRKLFY
jgi:thioredoxin reductase (NADPH)